MLTGTGGFRFYFAMPSFTPDLFPLIPSRGQVVTSPHEVVSASGGLLPLVQQLPLRLWGAAAPAAGAAPAQAATFHTFALARQHTAELLAAFLEPLREPERRLYCFDGANRFQPQQLALQARRRGLDPAGVLDRVFVSRAYTCHQLVTALETLPIPPGDFNAGVLVLGFDHLFHDGNVPRWERQYLFDRGLQAVHRISRNGHPVLLITEGPIEGTAARSRHSLASAAFRSSARTG